MAEFRIGKAKFYEIGDEMTGIMKGFMERGYTLAEVIQAFNMRACQQIVERKDVPAAEAMLVTCDTRNRAFLQANGFTKQAIMQQ